MSESATDKLRKMLDELGVEWWESRAYGDGTVYTFWRSPTFGRVYAMENDDGKTLFMACLNNLDFTPEQAIAATLGKEKAGRKSPPEGGPGPCGQPSDDIVHDAATPGKRKAKAHPYGYEPDTGAFDVTRCECGCLNDISATYCNDCGGVIEVDIDAEKEIYHAPRHSVFAEKHDDGSLELGGKRYVAETPGSGKLTAEQVVNAVMGSSVYGSYDGTFYASGIDMHAITDKLNAVLAENRRDDERKGRARTVPAVR